MTKPAVRLDIDDLTDAEATEVARLLSELGLEGEERSGHLGVTDWLEPLMTFGTDSLQSFFEGVVAAAGGAAAAKLGDLVKRLPAGKTRTPDGEPLTGVIVSGDTEGSGFLMDENVQNSEEAVTVMLHFDLSALPEGTLMVWDPGARRWRAR
jgi:hypothetical protein